MGGVTPANDCKRKMNEEEEVLTFSSCKRKGKRKKNTNNNKSEKKEEERKRERSFSYPSFGGRGINYESVGLIISQTISKRIRNDL